MTCNLDTNLPTEVGPSTALGTLLRRFWIPSLRLHEVESPNCSPVRVRLVGEDFIAWRDGSGTLSFMAEHCPHRGASLALGHGEGDGLRCIYHGWKFAADGTIMETPNCKAKQIRERVTARTYPAREAGGLLWVYLGPKEKEPPFPHYAFFDSPVRELAVYEAEYGGNFLRMIEAAIDPAHPHILHQDPEKLGPKYVKELTSISKGQGNYIKNITASAFESDDSAPDVEVDDMLFGTQGVAIHDALADGDAAKYARVYTWVLPFLVVLGPNVFAFSIPVDDNRTLYYLIVHMPEVSDSDRDNFVRGLAGPDSNYEGRRLRFGPAERWGQNRSRMETSFTGIEGLVPEDAACVFSPGPNYDRSREHLVPSDLLMFRFRRRLMNVLRDFEAGKEPYAIRPEDSVSLGADMCLLPDPSAWRQVMVSKSLSLMLDEQPAQPARDAFLRDVSVQA